MDFFDVICVMYSFTGHVDERTNKNSSGIDQQRY